MRGYGTEILWRERKLPVRENDQINPVRVTIQMARTRLLVNVYSNLFIISDENILYKTL